MVSIAKCRKERETSLPKKRNILYLFSSTRYYGAKKHFIGFIQYADIDLVDITVISAKDNFPADVKERLKAIKFQEYDFRRLNNWVKWFTFLRKNKPHQIIFAETWFNDFRWPALFAGWLLTWGNIYMMEFTDILPGLGGAGRGIIGKWNLEKDNLRLRAFLSKRILTVSESMKRKMIHYYNYTERKIKVAYFPIDTNKFSPRQGMDFEIRDRHGIPSTDLVCIVVSRLEKIKGVDKIIEAFNILLRNTYRKDIWLWILGDGSLRDDLISLACGNGLGDRVIFGGYKEGIEKYLQEADIYILGSEMEAQGISLMEAMSVGLICITTPTGGAKEIIQDTGYVVEHSAEGIANALFEVVKMNKWEMDKIKKKTREYVMDKFDRVEEARRHLNALDIPSITDAQLSMVPSASGQESRTRSVLLR